MNSLLFLIFTEIGGIIILLCLIKMLKICASFAENSSKIFLSVFLIICIFIVIFWMFYVFIGGDIYEY